MHSISRFLLNLTSLFTLLTIPWLAAAGDPPAKGPVAPVLQEFVDKKALAGAVVLVADKEKVLDLEAVGFADIDNNQLMAIDSIFWIASQSKPITAALLMMLVDEGKIGLDDLVEKYLPELKDIKIQTKDKELKRPERPLTIRTLLNHTSGMPFNTAAERPTMDGLTLKDAVQSYVQTPLKTEPGTKYAYSNAGINTAGRVIEVVSGMSFEDFLQKRLCVPLGMKDTTFWPSEVQLKRLAKSYSAGPDKKGLVEVKIGPLQYPLSDRKRLPVPAGGLFSTARDVGAFCQMVLNQGTFQGKRLLSADAVQQMTSRQTGDLKENYGLGWSTNGPNVGHGGAYATNMNIDTQRGLVTVWLVQHAGVPGDGGLGAFRKIAADQFGKKRE